MKSIKDFENQKLTINNMRSIIGGESQCVHVEDTSEGTCWDNLRTTYNNEGRRIDVELIVREASVILM